MGPNEAPVDVPDADLDVPPPPYNDDGTDGVIKVHAVIHSEESEATEGEKKISEKDEITKSQSQ